MNLATLLQDLGERDEARRLYTEAIDGRTAQLGAPHADTLDAKMNVPESQGSLGYLQGIDGFESSYAQIDRCGTAELSKLRTMP